MQSWVASSARASGDGDSDSDAGSMDGQNELHWPQFASQARFVLVEGKLNARLDLLENELVQLARRRECMRYDISWSRPAHH